MNVVAFTQQVSMQVLVKLCKKFKLWKFPIYMNTIIFFEMYKCMYTHT